MKSIYRHTQSCQLFAIETDASSSIQSVCGPLKEDKLDPRVLDYDDYWNWQTTTALPDYQRLTRNDYQELLKENGFLPNFSQPGLF